MRKLKDAHAFSNEEGSIAKFFIVLALYSVWQYCMELTTSLLDKRPFEWWGALMMVLAIAAFATVAYFITRFLAYQTKIFPKTENREGIHGVSFVFLLLISFVLFVILA